MEEPLTDRSVSIARPYSPAEAEFAAVAEMLDQDPDLLFAGDELVSFIRLPDFERARQVLSRATDEQRAKRGATFFDAIRARQRLGQGMHDRGEAVVFADSVLHEPDLRGIQNHLPIRVKTVSVWQKRVPAGTEWDLSVRATDWDFDDDMEELYVLANFGTLVLEPEARLVVRGNVFSMVCQELVRLRPVPEQPGRRRVGRHHGLAHALPGGSGQKRPDKRFER